MLKIVDLRKSPYTRGPVKQVGRNSLPTIVEFEDACSNGFPDQIKVRSIEEVVIAMGGDSGTLGDRKQLYYLAARNRHPVHDEETVTRKRKTKQRKTNTKRHLVLIKEVT
jgi:hypothetical protein